jgi:hypothetical protein
MDQANDSFRLAMGCDRPMMLQAQQQLGLEQGEASLQT